MIRGMTGKASLRFSMPEFDAELEVRSVNSRYFEFRMKTPPRYAALEIEARKIVSQKIGRGKVDLVIRINEKQINTEQSLINKEFAQVYLQEVQKLAQELGINEAISIREILSLPQVLNTDFTDLDDNTQKIFLDKIEELIDLMFPMMEEEGKSTLIDIQNSLQLMEVSLGIVKVHYPVSLAKYKQSLMDRVKEISSLKAPEERLSIELELYASRTAINEEIVRLENHIRVMKDILEGKKSNSSSKELDFIGQEMNREVNTIASKSSDYQIIEQTIILKSEIEKMREQFRNIV